MWIDEVPATGPAGPQIPIGETKLTAQKKLTLYNSIIPSLTIFFASTNAA